MRVDEKYRKESSGLLLPRRRLIKSLPGLLLPSEAARAQFSGQRTGFWTTPGQATATGGGSGPPPGTRTTPVSAYITTYPSNSGSNFWASCSAHWAGFNAAMGITAPVFGGAITSNQPGTYSCTPDTWPGTISSQISSMTFLPSGTKLMVTWNWQNNSGLTLYSDMAQVTNTLYGGQLIAYWVQQALATWKSNGYTELYLRPCWEWNWSAPWAQSVCAAGVSTATFVKAFQNFYTTCHNYAAANGMTVHVCWNPSIYGQSDPCGNTLASQFPNQNPGDKFVDIVCADFYAEAGTLPTFSSSDPTVWTLPALVALANKWNIAFGFCELGGLKYPDGGSSAAGTWIPDVAAYVASVGSSTSCAIAGLWDVNTGLDSTSDLEWTASGAGQSAVIAAWKSALGPSGTMKTI